MHLEASGVHGLSRSHRVSTPYPGAPTIHPPRFSRVTVSLSAFIWAGIDFVFSSCFESGTHLRSYLTCTSHTLRFSSSPRFERLRRRRRDLSVLQTLAIPVAATSTSRIAQFHFSARHLGSKLTSLTVVWAHVDQHVLPLARRRWPRRMHIHAPSHTYSGSVPSRLSLQAALLIDHQAHSLLPTSTFHESTRRALILISSALVRQLRR